MIKQCAWLTGRKRTLNKCIPCALFISTNILISFLILVNWVVWQFTLEVFGDSFSLEPLYSSSLTSFAPPVFNPNHKHYALRHRKIWRKFVKSKNILWVIRPHNDNFTTRQIITNNTVDKPLKINNVHQCNLTSFTNYSFIIKEHRA